MSLGTKQQQVDTGLDLLVEERFARLKGLKLGVVANQCSINRSFEHLVDLLKKVPELKLVRLFAPEHGIRGTLQDMEQVKETSDPISGVPVVSLYGSGAESFFPKGEHLEDLDAVLVDLPDIGTRYYTFAQTLAYMMMVAGKGATKIIVVDRPNPIGGCLIEGCSLEKSCRSFCGLAPVPQRHGLTIGELARLMHAGFGSGEQRLDPIGCSLEIVPCRGWSRDMYFDQTGLPWVLPSPNMPLLETALVYPGACLFEATNLSEGRGTTRPFELLGAPFIEPERWIAQTLAEGFALEGAVLRPTGFVPKFQKWANQLCQGVQLHVTDRELFRPLRWGLALISAANRLYPKQFKLRSEAYEFVDSVPAMDLLYGSQAFRSVLGSRGALSELEPELSSFEREFLSNRQPFLLY